MQGLANEQRDLLDAIDQLRFAQLDDNIKLPQIAVVGDQSAGKSSVLQALCGIQFPKAAGACTRFATEVILRRSPQEKLRVSIRPDPSRSLSERDDLAQFGGYIQKDVPFARFITDATAKINGSSVPGRFASQDVLVVEKSGPDMPMLTLVDLPGLVRVQNNDHTQEDVRAIAAISDNYMKSPTTIILAVIAGNNDFVQAPILEKVREFDPNRLRTIGVVTKPDTTRALGLEDKFINLIMNRDSKNEFRLGWYAMLNPGPEEDWISPEERAVRETEFFMRGPWATLPSINWGVASLKRKLSKQLIKHIGAHIDALRQQIQDTWEKYHSQLKLMGPSHDTPEEMRRYVGELFMSSQHLVEPAVHGDCRNPPGKTFFLPESDHQAIQPQRLRARVHEESIHFSNLLRSKGRKVNFTATTTGAHYIPGLGALMGNSKKDYAKKEVEPILRDLYANELPGDSNSRAPYVLFMGYSKAWPRLAEEYKANVGAICKEFIHQVLEFEWPIRMRLPIQHYYIDEKMKTMLSDAEQELGRLVKDLTIEIQPFDPEYKERLDKWRRDNTEDGGSYTEAEEVLEKMLIYYDMNAKIFIKNVIVQVVERHLLAKVRLLFNPIEMMSQPEQTIQDICANDEETRLLRVQLKEKLKQVEQARGICANLAIRGDLRSSFHETQSEQSDIHKSFTQETNHRLPTPPYGKKEYTIPDPPPSRPPKPTAAPPPPPTNGQPSTQNMGYNMQDSGQNWDNSSFELGSQPPGFFPTGPPSPPPVNNEFVAMRYTGPRIANTTGLNGNRRQKSTYTMV